MSRKMLRVLAVLVLVTLTATGAAQAAGRTVHRAETSAFAAAWDWVAGWLRSVPVFAGMSVKANAAPAMDPSVPTLDEGSQMDPNGVK